MAAIGALTTWRAECLSRVADIAGVLSPEALYGMPWAFDKRVHAVRPHRHQIDCAAHFRHLIEGSEYPRFDNSLHVQDAYTLCCIRQVHGAAHEAILRARQVIKIEQNSATDDPPILFEDEGRTACPSGGSFQGELVALAGDYLAMALAESGNISQRRLARLLDETTKTGHIAGLPHQARWLELRLHVGPVCSAGLGC